MHLVPLIFVLSIQRKLIFQNNAIMNFQYNTLLCHKFFPLFYLTHVDFIIVILVTGFS